jgi:tetratricopeptide (TPR) repeat protein
MQMLLTRYALFYGYLLLVNTLRGTLPKDFQSKKPSSILRSIIRMGKASSVNVRRFAEDYGGFLLALERLLIKQKPQEALQTLQTQVEQTVTQKSGFIANVCISHATAHENLQWYTVFLLGELHYFVKNYQEAKNLFQECIQHNFQATVSYCMGALSMIGLVRN